MSLVTQLDALPASVRELLDHHAFDRERFLTLASAVGRRQANAVRGEVTPPAPGDVEDLPEPGSALHREATELGEATIRAGHAALVVLAGGMATRMGGVVKALMPVLGDRSFFDLRLTAMRRSAARFGGSVPLWLMTSHATHQALVERLGELPFDPRVQCFTQGVSLRMTGTGELWLDERGYPSLHATGHGDLPDALRRSGVLEAFVERGGQVVTVANVDNLGATVEPLLIGLHLLRQKAVTCELVDKVGSDRGGIPARLDGRPVILEEFRLPAGFDAQRVRTFNTNTFHFDASALLDLDMPWTWFQVAKSVEGRDLVQLERLLGEVTENLDTRFVRVPRSGPGSRFLPVKDADELDRRRGEIELVCRDRGLLEETDR